MSACTSGRLSLTATAFDSLVWDIWKKDIGDVDGDGDMPHPQEALRVILLIGLFGFTFFTAMLSLLLRGEWAQSHVLSFVSCIGGGVFLGACMLDLLPDALESFEKAELAIKFPLPYACVAGGFLLVLLIDQIARTAKEQGCFGSGARHMHLHSHDHDEAHSSSSHSRSQPYEETDESKSGLGPIMLVLALSIHALFEGLSLAVTSDATKLLQDLATFLYFPNGLHERFQIFGALLIHKGIMGFCLGVRLVQAGMSKPWLALCAFAFSVQVLVGGLAGVGIMQFISGGEQKYAAIVASIMQAISCGTFLYITTFEVLPHELQKGRQRLLKMFFVFVGFAAIIIFLLVFPDAA